MRKISHSNALTKKSNWIIEECDGEFLDRPVLEDCTGQEALDNFFECEYSGNDGDKSVTIREVGPALHFTKITTKTNKYKKCIPFKEDE